MEVSLVSKRGMPDDAIISIRSGAVRRQGAVSAEKPFRFPQISESDCVVKVDIMQNMGSGYLVMRPNQKEGKQYEVLLGGDSEMACELAVKPADGDGPSPAEAQADSAAAAKTKQDAKAYLESTGLLAFVQGVLQVVAKQQPQDPFAAMAKHFLSASDEAEAPTPGSPKTAPASPKAAPPSPKAVAETTTASPEAEAAGRESVHDGAQEAKQEVEKAESDHVDDHKSDTLEEFTSTVRGATLPVDTEEPKAEEKKGETVAEEAEATEAAKEKSSEAAEAEPKATMEEVAKDAPEAAAEASAPEAEGQGEAVQAEAAETAAVGADEKKEDTAEEPKEGGE